MPHCLDHAIETVLVLDHTPCSPLKTVAQIMLLDHDPALAIITELDFSIILPPKS